MTQSFLPHPLSTNRLILRQSDRRPRPRRRQGHGAPVELLESRQLLTVLPSGFAEAQVGTSDLVSPTAMTLAPDGRVFVAEQAGELLVIKNGQILPTPFLTVQTDATNERGLVGVELDPNFATNGYVYVTYVATQPDFHLRLSRYTANGDVAAAGSETILYETGPMRTSIHLGGAIHFGPDGKLYMSVGENGGAAAAQDLSSHKGKILRLNPDGSIPADNPFVGQTTGNLGAIWAVGFRNPFSFALQPTTGKLLANDVGTAVWEEVDEVVAGANYGYPDVEGPTNDPRFRTPLYSYQHVDGCAVVGASFYNPANATFPAGYVGKYFFADLCKRYIKSLDPATGQVSSFASVIAGRPVDIDVAADGSLYYLARPNLDTTGQPGGVFRVSFTNSGAPSIAIQPQNTLAGVGRPATFTVSAAGAAPLSYQWQREAASGGGFADIPGATAASYTLSAVSAADNGAQFRVVVSNGSGSVTSNPAALTLATGQAPVATINTLAEPAFYSGGDTISFSGSATDPEDGALPASAFTWRIDLHHDEQGNPHVHPEMPPLAGVTSGTYTVPIAGHTETAVWLRLALTVRDSSGLETTVFRDINPNKSAIAVGTNVDGLRVNVDGAPTRTPGSFESVVGVERMLAAPATQTVNGVTYEFVSWSNGQPAAHAFLTPAAAASFSATYRALDDGSQNPATSPDLTAAMAGVFPPAAVTGASGRARVRVTNTGATPTTGPITVALYASPDAWLDPEDTAVTSTVRNLNLRPGGSRMMPIRFIYPQVVDGSYHLLAYADSLKVSAERNEANNVAVSAAPVTIAPPFVDLSASFTVMGVTPAPSRRGLATLLVRNDGNVPARGLLSVALAASSDQVADSSDLSLGTVTVRMNIRAGGSRLVRLRFVPPATTPAGQYYVTAALDPNNAINERNESNNIAASSNVFTIG